MLFTLTTIRINSETKVFENTETHRFMLLGELEAELIDNGCDFSQFEDILKMEKGNSKTIEAIHYKRTEKREKGLRFMYINRVN